MNRLFKSALTLGFVALSILVLVPVCSAAENHAAESACCTILDESPLADSSAQVAWQPRASFVGAPPLPRHSFAAGPSARVALASGGAPPPSRLSYYARSSRILS